MIMGIVYNYTDWSYQGSNGPEYWYKNFPIAAGDYQSPVDIQTRNIIYDPALGDINFIGYHASPGKGFRLRNTGYAIKIDLQGNMSINGADFKNSFDALQIQFHWGSHNEQGSEHLLDSRAYPMELHIFHKNEKYGEDDTLLKTDGLVILAIMVEISDKDNEGLKLITEHLHKVKHKDQEFSMPPFPLSTLLPLDTEKFYQYPGSLTAPPCNECVTWIVFHKTIKASPALLKKWRSLMTKPDNTEVEERLVDNFRPPQSLKKRIVTASLKLQDKLVPSSSNSSTASSTSGQHKGSVHKIYV